MYIFQITKIKYSIFEMSMFFSTYIIFLPIFHCRRSVHVVPPSFLSLILLLPLAPFPHQHPGPIPPHSWPLRPVPALVFQLLIIMPDWLTSPGAGLIGRFCMLPTVERNTNFSQKEKVTIKPPSHVPVTCSANTSLGRKERRKKSNWFYSPLLHTPPLGNHQYCCYWYYSALTDISHIYLEKPKLANITLTAISGLVFHPIFVQFIVSRIVCVSW